MAGDKTLYLDLIDRNNIDLNLIDESSKEKGVIFKHFPLQNQVSFGEPNVANANYIIDILSYGALGCLKKEFKGLITGPINKELINESGFEFSGHTEFLSDISNAKKVVMLLMNKKLKIALLTTHIPLSEVPSKISKKNLEETVSIISEEFKNTWKIENPSICLLGLNPHAGEQGILGNEEKDWLNDALIDWREKNKDTKLLGPLSPDSCWNSSAKAWRDEDVEKHDGILAMYHDQGLIPMKVIAFNYSVNTTIGLPFIRTSPDHGTGFDIAGKGIAESQSMIEAIKTAIEISKNSRLFNTH